MLSNWEIDMDTVRLGATLGTGAFGAVRRAEWCGIDVAVKVSALAWWSPCCDDCVWVAWGRGCSIAVTVKVGAFGRDRNSVCHRRGAAAGLCAKVTASIIAFTSLAADFA